MVSILGMVLFVALMLASIAGFRWDYKRINDFTDWHGNTSNGGWGYIFMGTGLMSFIGFVAFMAHLSNA